MAEWSSEDIEKSSPFPLIDVDRYNLKLTDAEFEPHTWENLKTVIAQNDLSNLRRWPSDLRRYVKWSSETKAKYGSVPNYIMAERLGWTPVEVSPTKGPVFESQSNVPFKDERDYKIMPNDWPYGLADGITHIIVWLKTRLEVEPSRGDLTDESRTLVKRFIEKTFVQPLETLPGPPKERVMWFRNWTALQSVPGMEHVHLLVRDVPQETILKWTKGETMKQG